MRKCIVTGTEKPKPDLIRFVIGPAGEVVPDLDGKLPGRGLWVSAERDVVDKACARRLFAKAARSRAEPPDGLTGLLERQLVERCVGLLGMARRSGSVVSGYEKVRAYLLDDKAGMLLAAREGAEGGRRKLRNCAPDLIEWDQLDGVELARALGREAVIHVAIARGPLAQRLTAECGRLAGFRQTARRSDDV